MKPLAYVSLALTAIVLSGGACVYKAFSAEAIPIVVTSVDFASPDGQFVATVERVHNGLGYGAGALYEEVHLSRVPKPLFKHGDPDPSVVFYVEPVSGVSGAPTVQWIESARLRVILDPRSKPNRKPASIGQVWIEYEGPSS
ncbi:hypothetical protein [Rhizobacter sp. P5_C2]